MSVQTTTIEVDQMTAVILKAKAEAKGITIADWLRTMVETETLVPPTNFFETASPEDRAKAVEQWASQHRSTAPPLSDEAISRATIYADREDKQL